jgi:hypothetical protein
VHRLVDDLERHKRGQFEILQADADLGGTLSNEADVRRGDEDFVDTARPLIGTLVGAANLHPCNRWKWVSVKLKEGGRVRSEIERTEVSHPEVRELRQLAQLARQPFELIFADLERT